MVPEDLNDIPAAIESALGRLEDRLRRDRSSVAADRSMSPAARDGGVAAIDAMGERAEDLLRTLHGRPSAEQVRE